jgi:1-acyl-sn-glycerol-3-phosphate acyltransferase
MNAGRRALDRLARALARLLLGVFFRTTEVQGAEHVPARGPVLFVANHGNALVDPMVLVAVLPRLPRFLAKHTLWSNPAVWPLLQLSGAVPVHRAHEGDTLRNLETFERCFEEFAAGGAVAVFPEGVSHDQPELQPLRTGAARIALGAREHGADPVAIVPVGLTFEDKDTFRSRLLVTIGEAIPATDDAGARELTEQIDAGLRAVTLNVDSWRTAKLVERAAEIYGADAERALPGRSGLADHFSLRHAFGAGYERARAANPERVAALEAMANRYEHLLEAFHLRDDHVTSDYPWSHVTGYVADRVPALLAQLPFALVGFALNYLPYRLPGFVAKRVEHEGDQPATYKLLSGLVLFPVAWAIEIAIAGGLWGIPGALAMAVIAPATGWIALRFYERNESFWSETRAYLTLRAVKHRAAELRALRRMMREELAALVG